MPTLRLIPRLDIKGPNLVKGVHLEGLRVLGRPQDFARHYYECGVDELMYVDAVASLYGRNSLLDMVQQTSREVFVPLTVGGGLRSIEDIQEALRAGADKVSLNTAALRTPSLITAAAHRFGSSTIVVTIEAKQQPDGSYEAYTDNGRERTGVDAVEWARQASELGAGEIAITSIDREGTGRGFDLTLTRLVTESVAVPVICCGGCGTVAHLRDLLTETSVEAVALGAILHYGALPYLDRQHRPAAEGNTDYLNTRGAGYAAVDQVSVHEIKASLQESNICCCLAGPMPTGSLT